MPSGTGARRTSADRPARATPAFAKPKNRDDQEGHPGLDRVLQDMERQIRNLGPPGRRTQRNRQAERDPRQGRVDADRRTKNQRAAPTTR